MKSVYRESLSIFEIITCTFTKVQLTATSVITSKESSL